MGELARLVKRQMRALGTPEEPVFAPPPKAAPEILMTA
jgi:hypothetical protein